MASEWYLTRDGQQIAGPYTSQQLKQLAASGQLLITDHLRREGMADWVPAQKVKGLFSAGPPGSIPTTTPVPPNQSGGGAVLTCQDCGQSFGVRSDEIGSGRPIQCPQCGQYHTGRSNYATQNHEPPPPPQADPLAFDPGAEEPATPSYRRSRGQGLTGLWIGIGAAFVLMMSGVGIWQSGILQPNRPQAQRDKTEREDNSLAVTRPPARATQDNGRPEKTTKEVAATSPQSTPDEEKRRVQEEVTRQIEARRQERQKRLAALALREKSEIPPLEEEVSKIKQEVATLDKNMEKFREQQRSLPPSAGVPGGSKLQPTITPEVREIMRRAQERQREMEKEHERVRAEKVRNLEMAQQRLLQKRDEIGQAREKILSEP